MNELMKFLENHEGKRLWVLTPSGAFTGILETIPEEVPNAITLTNAFIFVADMTSNVKEVSIDIHQITAWGSGELHFGRLHA